MNLAQKLMTNTLIVLPLTLVLAACSTVPQTDANNDGVRDTTERPRFFGRNAWDRKHARQTQNTQTQNAQTQDAQAQPMPSAPPAAQIALATPPPAQTQPNPASTVSSAPAAEKRAPLFSWPKAKPAPKTETTTRPPEATPVQIAAPPPAQPVPPSANPPKPKRAPLFSWPKPAETPKARTPQITGGYAPATDKQAVADAAAFALSEAPGYKFSAVYSAKVQIVSGTNYSLCLWVRRPAIEPNPFSRRMVAATVFKGLDQHYELVSWREVEHCRAG